MNSFKCYDELLKFETFEERFNYLKLDGTVGKSTFGHDRWINQNFYRSYEWTKIRRDVLIRDIGCEFGLPDFPIKGNIVVHHINPITVEDVIRRKDVCINPQYLICVSYKTHEAIHYGDLSMVSYKIIERFPGDTKLW